MRYETSGKLRLAAFAAAAFLSTICAYFCAGQWMLHGASAAEADLPSVENALVFRYVGDAEGRLVMASGMVPNTSKSGEPKEVFFTSFKTDSSSEAERVLKIGRFDPRGVRETPKYRVEAKAPEVEVLRAGCIESSGALEFCTVKKVKAERVVELCE